MEDPCDACTFYSEKDSECRDPSTLGNFDDCPKLAAFRLWYEQQAKAAYSCSPLDF